MLHVKPRRGHRSCVSTAHARLTHCAQTHRYSDSVLDSVLVSGASVPIDVLTHVLRTARVMRVSPKETKEIQYMRAHCVRTAHARLRVNGGYAYVGNQGETQARRTGLRRLFRSSGAVDSRRARASLRPMYCGSGHYGVPGATEETQRRLLNLVCESAHFRTFAHD
jgi:hypothetical protein